MVSVMARERFLFMVSVVARERFLWFPSWQGTFFYGFRRWFFYGFRLLQDRGCLSDGNRKKNTRTFPRRTKYIYIYIYMSTLLLHPTSEIPVGAPGPEADAASPMDVDGEAVRSLFPYLLL